MAFSKMKPSKKTIASIEPVTETTTETESTLDDELASLTNSAILSTCKNIMSDWTLAVFEAETKHIEALERTKEQIERVQEVKIVETYGQRTETRGSVYFLVARVQNANKKRYLTRIASSGEKNCGCRDFKFNKKSLVCKHLVRLAIECLDSEVKGHIYYI